MDLFLEGVYRLYGYDLRDYDRASIRRRIWNQVHALRLNNITALLEKVLHEPRGMKELIANLMVNVTSMFRDPKLYLAFREHVIPMLRSYPSIRIWHAGCATGEEVISMAILLREEGLLEKSRIYATDISIRALHRARQGIFPLGKMQEYTTNYFQAGGKDQFSLYYKVSGNTVAFDPSLIQPIVFSEHNLATDGAFNEFNVIFCRNVLIYFNKELQNRVHDLFYESLAVAGFLILGDKESIHFTKHESRYTALSSREKLYRKDR